MRKKYFKGFKVRQLPLLFLAIRDHILDSLHYKKYIIKTEHPREMENWVVKQREAKDGKINISM